MSKWYWTSMYREKYRGFELVCDKCNCKYDGKEWFYGRYEKGLVQPYGFYCQLCAEEMGY